MANLAEWLLAQYDADEQIARAAAEVNPPPWRLHQWQDEDTGLVLGGETATNRHLDGALWDNEGADSLSMEVSTARHVARHDPAAVLADLAAKRRIVELIGEPWCQECAIDGEVLRLLALPYADRDGYDPAWAPD